MAVISGRNTHTIDKRMIIVTAVTRRIQVVVDGDDDDGVSKMAKQLN